MVVCVCLSECHSLRKPHKCNLEDRKCVCVCVCVYEAKSSGAHLLTQKHMRLAFGYIAAGLGYCTTFRKMLCLYIPYIFDIMYICFYERMNMSFTNVSCWPGQ